MSRQTKLGKTATNVRTVNGYTVVRYHQTDVVTFDALGVKLDSGGWRTATTKTRMNQAANQYGLGFHVYQTKGEWFVAIPFRFQSGENQTLPFEDGMSFNYK